MTSHHALRLAQTLYDMWFDPIGHRHDGYPDVYVVVDEVYLDVARVEYDEITNEITITTVPDADVGVTPTVPPTGNVAVVVSPGRSAHPSGRPSATARRRDVRPTIETRGAGVPPRNQMDDDQYLENEGQGAAADDGEPNDGDRSGGTESH